MVGFSDIQADIARELIKAGIEVWISNHRTVEGILGYVRRLGAMIGAAQAANALAAKLTEHLDSVAKQAASLPARPRVYFEEWDDPMISGVGWVSEIIEIAGGTDIFADHARSGLARGRIIADPFEVVRRRPDLLLASWCGKKYQPETVWVRPGWEELEPVQRRRAYEIPAEIILQPGPASLTDGLDTIYPHHLRVGQRPRTWVGSWPLNRVPNPRPERTSRPFAYRDENGQSPTPKRATLRQQRARSRADLDGPPLDRPRRPGVVERHLARRWLYLSAVQHRCGLMACCR